MPPLKNNSHSTLPPGSALAALFFPAGEQLRFSSPHIPQDTKYQEGSYQEVLEKTPTQKSAERNEETEADEEARNMVPEEEDWTDDDDFIPNIN